MGDSMKVVLAGGTGFLGQALASFLTQHGYEICILTRGQTRLHNGLRYIHWDGRSLTGWENELEGAHAIINFSGRSVNCLYTKKNKREIVTSRMDAVQAIDRAVMQLEQKPKVLVQAGSLAIFGNTTQLCEEVSPHGEGFSVRVCEMWEEAFFFKSIPDVRKVMLRIGFALGKEGGALEPLMKLVRYGAGGTIGSGKQYISWLHIEDLNRMFHHVMEHEEATGIYNATGTEPVTNKVFMSTLRQAMGRGWQPSAPAPLVRMGAYLIMRADPELALSGRNCLPTRFLAEGFSFQFKKLETALSDIVKKE